MQGTAWQILTLISLLLPMATKKEKEELTLENKEGRVRKIIKPVFSVPPWLEKTKNKRCFQKEHNTQPEQHKIKMVLTIK